MGFFMACASPTRAREELGKQRHSHAVILMLYSRSGALPVAKRKLSASFILHLTRTERVADDEVRARRAWQPIQRSAAEILLLATRRPIDRRWRKAHASRSILAD